MSDFLIPLGGGNEIGGSAYYLSLEGIHVLFDCGARLKGEELYPDYEDAYKALRLLTNEVMKGSYMN